MSNDVKKEFKPLKIWVSGESKPKEYKSALDALKDVKTIQSATSASIEINEIIGTEGSTITSREGANLRNWAVRELNAIQGSNKKLSFFDVKYIPKEHKVDKSTGQITREYSAKLVFRASQPKDKD